MKSLFILLKDYFFELLYPRNLTCVLCHSEVDGKELCDVCLGSIQFNTGRVCGSCGRMILSGAYPVCENCKTLNRYYDRGISVVTYDEYIKKLIFNFKYHDKRYIAHTMAGYMLKEIINLDLDIEFDSIVPVPLHETRFKSRGFNQAELISHFLSEMTGLKVDTSLKRISNTKPLNKLSSEERHDVLSDAFELTESIKKNIILIDDIFTTGATVNACALKLKEMGSGFILVTTFAVGE